MSSPYLSITLAQDFKLAFEVQFLSLLRRTLILIVTEVDSMFFKGLNSFDRIKYYVLEALMFQN